MKKSNLLSLHDIKLLSIEFNLKSIFEETKTVFINPEEIDFNFKPLTAKSNSKLKALQVDLKSTDQQADIFFQIVLMYEYEILNDADEKRDLEIAVNVAFPHVYSMARGFILNVSGMTKRPTILPVVDLLESMREKEIDEYVDEKPKLKKKISVTKRKKVNKKQESIPVREDV